MLSSHIKQRWRTAQLCIVIEERLKLESVWLESDNQLASAEDISRRLSMLVSKAYSNIESLPVKLSYTQLSSLFFNGFSQLIEQSANGAQLTKIDYLIIRLARNIALNTDNLNDKSVQAHAQDVIQVASHWDKFIRRVNQRGQSRFTVS